MLQSEGDTGPLLMYTYARCCSIEENVPEQVCAEILCYFACSLLYQSDIEVNAGLLWEAPATNLALWLTRFEEVCARATLASEPSVRIDVDGVTVGSM